MTEHSQFSAFGALLLFQSEIEVNRPAAKEMYALDSVFHTRIVRWPPKEPVPYYASVTSLWPQVKCKRQ